MLGMLCWYHCTANLRVHGCACKYDSYCATNRDALIFKNYDYDDFKRTSHVTYSGVHCYWAHWNTRYRHQIRIIIRIRILSFFFLLQGCDAGDELDTLTTTRGPGVSRGSVISTPNTTTHQLIAIACSSMNASMCTADGLVACQWDEDHALCAPHCSALPKYEIVKTMHIYARLCKKKLFPP